MAKVFRPAREGARSPVKLLNDKSRNLKYSSCLNSERISPVKKLLERGTQVRFLDTASSDEIGPEKLLFVMSVREFEPASREMHQLNLL